MVLSFWAVQMLSGFVSLGLLGPSLGSQFWFLLEMFLHGNLAFLLRMVHMVCANLVVVLVMVHMAKSMVFFRQVSWQKSGV